jgi:hypothetical protein
MENTACREQVPVPPPASAISRSWRFISEAGILQLAQWQAPGHRYILFTGETQLYHDGINNTHNSYVCSGENPYATVERNFQLR